MSEVPSRSQLPLLIFAPYLPLRSAVEAGPWWIGSLESYTGTWRDARFEDVARRMIASHVAARGQAISNPALIASLESGVDGNWPDRRGMEALQLALHFTVLHCNPIWTEETRNQKGWQTATSDNSTIHFWPVDVDGEGVALRTGFMVQVLIGGYTLTSGVEIPAPEELHLPHGVSLDGEILDALRRVFNGDFDTIDAELAARLSTAVGWLAQAWRNTESIDLRQRIVMLKTGFEALTDTSETWQSAERLDILFQSIPLDATQDRFAEHLLWHPSETESMSWSDRSGRVRPCTPLNHWFRSFSACRNDIIHQGRMISSTYDESTRYQGPYLQIAERVLREAICASLRRFGYDDLWKSYSIRLLNGIVASSLGGTDLASREVETGDV
jgi:hypothetical protein